MTNTQPPESPENAVTQKPRKTLKRVLLALKIIIGLGLFLALSSYLQHQGSISVNGIDLSVPTSEK